MEKQTKVSKAQQRAVNKYVKENYDRINVTFPKGQKEIIQAHAKAQGESVNAFINRALAETFNRDKSRKIEIELSWNDATILFWLQAENKHSGNKIEQQDRPIQIIYQRIIGDTTYPIFTFKNESELSLYHELINSLPKGTPLLFEFPADTTVDEVYTEIKNMKRLLDTECPTPGGYEDEAPPY